MLEIRKSHVLALITHLMMKKSMKKSWLLGLFICLIHGGAMAQTRYVIDELKINFRSGASNSHRIVRLLPSGTELTIIEADESGDWLHVRTKGGEDGWVLKQYLGNQPVARDLLADAQRRLAQATSQQQTLGTENVDIKQQNTSLQEQLSSTQEQASQFKTELDDIKRVARSTIELNTRHQKLMKDHQTLQTELDVANAKIDRLSDDSKQTWFLYGAIAVVIGVVLTLIIQNVRSRQRYSEWA